jgi:hypothetical protein
MGRSFTDADGPDSQRVAIVNQTFVRKFFHGTSPIGRYVDKDTMIVGMVGDVAIAPGLEVTAPLVGERVRMFLPRRWRPRCSIALGSTIRQAMVHIGAPGLRASVLGLVVGLVLCAGALRDAQCALWSRRL